MNQRFYSPHPWHPTATYRGNLVGGWPNTMNSVLHSSPYNVMMHFPEHLALENSAIEFRTKMRSGDSVTQNNCHWRRPIHLLEVHPGTTLRQVERTAPAQTSSCPVSTTHWKSIAIYLSMQSGFICEWALSVSEFWFPKFYFLSETKKFSYNIRILRMRSVSEFGLLRLPRFFQVVFLFFKNLYFCGFLFILAHHKQKFHIRFQWIWS